MRRWTGRSAGFALLLVLCGASGPASPPAGDPEPGVSWTLARERARSISNVRYDLRFRIPAEPTDAVRGRVRLRFRTDDRSRPLVIDFRQPAEHVRAVRIDGRPAPHRVANGHITLPGRVLRMGDNSVEIEFIAGDAPLNREPEYLYTLFVPNRASAVFPSFDQPNLKARYRLALEVPEPWAAVSNAPVAGRDTLGKGRVAVEFSETKPLSTYVFAFAAGEFEVESAVRDGRRMRMYHRETDEAKLDRNRDEIFDLHARALRWLEEYTDIPYPFDTFDFVLVPAFQFGGMEHPGAIYYRAESLLLDESATQSDALGRAGLIAHETAHMWFGDLVTMNWFDDVWTKEVLANFMAAKIVHPSFPEIDHHLRFLLAHYPAAYSVDRTDAPNAIRQELANLDEASSLYGAIIYNKAPIVMRQLEALVGPDAFRAGIRQYLDRFGYGNATWPDLVRIMDERTGEDLAAWSRVWIDQPDRPTVRTSLELDDRGRIASLELTQADPRGRGRVWTQPLEVLLASPDTIRRITVRMDRRTVSVPGAAGLPAPDYVLANGGGLGYGRFGLDARSRTFLSDSLPSIGDPVTRAVAWLSLWDALLEGHIRPAAMLRLGIRLLAVEDNELNVQRISRDLRELYWRFLPGPARTAVAGELEEALWQAIERASAATLKATYFRAYRSIALTERGVRRLERIWRTEADVPGLPLSERDRTVLAQELAVREVPGWRSILETQASRIDDSDRRERFRFILPALSANPDERETFFESLREPRNRRREPWVLEGVRYLHHPLRASSSERYIRPALELLREIRRTGDIFFPKRWLDATLRGHRSSEAAATVRSFLRDRPDYPRRLREKILQAADPLFRAAPPAPEPSSSAPPPPAPDPAPV